MPKKQPTHNELKQEAVNRLLALADAMTNIPIPPVLGHYLSLEKVYKQAGFDPAFPHGYHPAQILLDQFFSPTDTHFIIQRVCLPFIKLRKLDDSLAMRITGRSYNKWSDLEEAAKDDQDEEALMVGYKQDLDIIVEEFGDASRKLRSWVGRIQAATPTAPDAMGAGRGAAIPEKELPGPQPEEPPITVQQLFISLLWKTRKRRILLFIILAFLVICSSAMSFWRYGIPEESKKVIVCKIFPQICPKP